MTFTSYGAVWRSRGQVLSSVENCLAWLSTVPSTLHDLNTIQGQLPHKSWALSFQVLLSTT